MLKRKSREREKARKRKRKKERERKRETMHIKLEFHGTILQIFLKSKTNKKDMKKITINLFFTLMEHKEHVDRRIIHSCIIMCIHARGFIETLQHSYMYCGTNKL